MAQMEETVRVSHARPVELIDLLRFGSPGEPAVSPRSDRVAWRWQRIEPDIDDYRSVLMLTDVASGASEELTEGPGDRLPRWSPDGGTIAFVTDVDGVSQIAIVDLDTSSIRVLTSFSSGVIGAASWSPDGSAIACVTVIDDRDRPPPEPAARARFTADVVVLDRIPFKDGAGVLPPGRRRVVVVDVGSPEAWRPISSPDRDASDPAWAPDGRSIAYATQPTERGDVVALGGEIRVASLEGDDELVCALPHVVASPAWSPAGEEIAFLGRTATSWSAANVRVFVIAARGGDARCLTADDDATYEVAAISDLCPLMEDHGPVWSADGSSLLAGRSRRGRIEVVRIDVGTMSRDAVSDSACVLSWSASPDGEVLVSMEAAHAEPGDLFVRHLVRGGPARRLTELHRDVLADVRLIEPRPLVVEHGDVTIDGWVLVPEGQAPASGFPAVLEIHGGPAGMYAAIPAFEMQLLAARGFVVMWCNPRGSQGYGEAFAEAIYGRWGTVDVTDVLAFVDAAVARLPIDGQRIGVTGMSYGGYLTNVLAGRRSDVFAAAVTDSSSVDHISGILTTTDDYLGWFPGHGGPPWVAPEAYLSESPLMDVGTWRTPTLIIHQELDQACPIGQAEELFLALRWQRVESEFVRYPGEHHTMRIDGRPWHRVDRLDRLVSWFERHLAGGVEDG
jgi:dipeptidyl aminopeptidase/acylaminoacyl peptidase